jgi:hypothetical protein
MRKRVDDNPPVALRQTRDSIWPNCSDQYSLGADRMTDDARTRRLRALAKKWDEMADFDADSNLQSAQAFAQCASELEAVLDIEGDRPAQLPCGCYIAQCPTHRSHAEGDASPAPQWQPIAASPVEEKAVALLWWPYWSRRPVIGQRKHGRWYSLDAISDAEDAPGPTHWMPLPDPPVQP